MPADVPCPKCGSAKVGQYPQDFQDRLRPFTAARSMAGGPDRLHPLLVCKDCGHNFEPAASR